MRVSLSQCLIFLVHITFIVFIINPDNMFPPSRMAHLTLLLNIAAILLVILYCDVRGERSEWGEAGTYLGEKWEDYRGG